jgi:glycolate oxidase iron-sulfur subunit
VSFAALHEATIRVLTANGCEVVAPEGQLCCGALAAHAGVRDIARQLARTNLDVFLGEDFDAVITNAAGCGSTLKEYDQLFSADDPAQQKAHEFRGKMRDVTEFLDGLGMNAPLHELRMRVTYQDSCHLAHGQKIREAPRRLIRAVPGVELTEMRLSDNCCGSAGVYNVTETKTSLELLSEKMHCAAETGAEVIVTANPGCLLQMRAGSDIHKTGQQVLHVMELLDRALDGVSASASSRR